MALYIPAGDYVGCQEASEIIGCTIRTMRRLVENHEIRFYEFSPCIIKKNESGQQDKQQHE